MIIFGHVAALFGGLLAIGHWLAISVCLSINAIRWPVPISSAKLAVVHSPNKKSVAVLHFLLRLIEHSEHRMFLFKSPNGIQTNQATGVSRMNVFKEIRRAALNTRIMR